ncbi:MAG: transglutaminase family protein, partial [Saprospiraceae bacterium]|nr:transglutaminase family protein [Saprospiraceae bacterium]
MNYRVLHKTEYTYQHPATLCHNIICQGPSNNPFQKVKVFKCSISPEPFMRQARIDFFDNSLTYFSIEQTHTHLNVEVESEVQLEEPPWISKRANESMPWEEVRAHLHTTAAKNDTRQFYLASPHVSFHSQITQYARKSFTSGRPIMDATMELCSRIFADFSFTPGFTEISTPVDSVFDHRKGVCQDFAHLALSCLRSLGLAARYVSGYIETVPPPGKEKLVGSDASHAWIAVFVPKLGWVEYDATNNLLVNDQHIRAAYGRDFSDVVP